MADLSKETVAGLDRIASLFSQIHRSENGEGKKLTFIAPNRSSFAATSIYKVLCDATVEKVRGFSDKREAESWLRTNDS